MSSLKPAATTKALTKKRERQERVFDSHDRCEEASIHPLYLAKAGKQAKMIPLKKIGTGLILGNHKKERIRCL
jgi:hypothetical protein